MRISDLTRGCALAAVLLLATALASPAYAAANVPTNYSSCAQATIGSNGVILPPECSYLGQIKASTSYAQLMADPIHRNFICKQDPRNRDCRVKGGKFDGYAEAFTSELVLEFHGSEELEGFVRTVVLPNVEVEVHSSAQDLAASSDVLETEMVRIQGRLPAGDPDFAELTVVGGTYNGFPSPGRTAVQLDEDGEGWTIDSSFEVGFTIHFVGADGSALEGHEGYIEGVSTMTAVGPLKDSDATDEAR